MLLFSSFVLWQDPESALQIIKCNAMGSIVEAA